VRVSRWLYGREAAIRPLPYPFRNYFTINSDCDGSIQDLARAAIELNGVIRETYGLPIADSFFPQWLFERGRPDDPAGSATPASFSERRFVERCPEWIRGFHRGWFDTIHGWVYNMSVRMAPDLLVPAGATEHVHRTTFGSQPPWEDPAPPRYLVLTVEGAAASALRVRLRAGSRAVLACEGRELAQTGDGRVLQPVPPEGPSGGPRTWATEPISLEIELAAPPASTVTIRDIALLTEIRADVLDQMTRLARFNIRAITFSSHAGGLVLAAPDGLRDQAAHAYFYSDEPESPHYTADLLRDYGLEFLNTFVRTHGDAVLPIEELVYPTRLRDGTTVYDYHRFLHLDAERPGAGTAANAVNPSWAEAAGKQIEKVLERLASREGCGAILYTHLNFGGPSHSLTVRGPTRDSICDAALHTALRVLAGRYFGLRVNVPAADRLYVAPTSVLLRQSATRQLLAGTIIYDPATNCVHVSPRYDPTLGREVPRREDGFRDLRGLTVYVDDAVNARLQVGSRNVAALIRNPPDESGRESVTVADPSAPRVILGRVPLQEAPVEIAARHGLTILGRAGDPGLRLRMDDSASGIVLRGGFPVITNYHYLAVGYHKTTRDIRYGLELHLENGLTLAWHEQGLQGGGSGCEVPAWSGAGPRLDVLPFWRLCPRSAAADRFPIGGIAEIRLAVSCRHYPGRRRLARTVGSWLPGGERIIHIHSILLLRDDERPLAPEGCLIGGRLPREEVAQLSVSVDGRRLEVDVVPGGFYFSRERVPRGSILAVEAIAASGQRLRPRTGKHQEILSDHCDIDFD
jgi:hypothetical protein